MAASSSKSGTDAPAAPPSAERSGPRFVHLHLHSEYSLLDGGNPLAWLLRLAFRVVVVVLALAIAIPVIVLGAGCLVVAVVIGLLLWGIRRIFGVRVGPQVSVSAMRAGFPAGVPANEEPPVQDGRDDGRENVRVRR